MRATPTAVLLSIVGGTACAQIANDGIKGLESCFQATSTADAICDNPANGAAQRLACLEKARTAQLECLEHVRAGMSVASPRPPMPTGVGPAEVRPEFSTARSVCWVGFARCGCPSRRWPANAAAPRLGRKRNDLARGLHPHRYSNDPPALQCAGRTEHSRHPLSRTAHRTPGADGWDVARLALRRSRGRLPSQRPSFRQEAVEFVDGRQGRRLQRRCGRLFAIGAGRRATEDQHARRGWSRPRGDVPVRRMGCRSKKDRSGMQVDACSRQGLIRETLSRGKQDALGFVPLGYGRT